MRVIIKPLGWAVLGTALLIVPFSLARSINRPDVGNKIAAGNAQASLSLLPAAPLAADATLLKNAGFEGDFAPVQRRSGQKARFEGKVAAPWAACFDWNDIDVAFSRGATNPHGGKDCQRVTVRSVRTGVAGLWQTLEIPETGTYRGAVYLRSAGGSPVPVTFTVLHHDPPFRVIGQTTITCRNEWQKAELTGEIPAGQSVNLVVQIPRDGTIDVDDATLARIGGTP